MRFLKYTWTVIASIALPALAEEVQSLKTCTAYMVDLKNLQEVPTHIEVYKKGDANLAKISQTHDGKVSSYDEKAQITENNLREGLTSKSLDLEDINIAEGLVAQAMAIEEDPVFEGRFQSGLDLKSVKSARVFQIGEATNMGMVAILEAKDKDGKDLGSFIGGSVVAACK